MATDRSAPKGNTSENPVTKWDKKLDDGTTVVYMKTRVVEGFVYNCEVRRQHSSSTTQTTSEKDLTRAEVETLPRFVDFVAGRLL
jgi:hypothetical protein